MVPIGHSKRRACTRLFTASRRVDRDTRGIVETSEKGKKRSTRTKSRNDLAFSVNDSRYRYTRRLTTRVSSLTHVTLRAVRLESERERVLLVMQQSNRLLQIIACQR